MLTRIRRYRLALLPVLALCLALGLAACGGGSDSDDAKKKLDEAFEKPIESADVTVDVAAEISGLPLVGGGIKAKLTGPYKSNGKDKTPSLDFDITASGVGQNVSAGVTSTEDNVYVTYGGQAYELGEENVEDATKNFEGQREKNTQDEKQLSAAGVNPADWVTDAKSEGDANVAGVDTEHISAKVDVDKVFDDANKLVQEAPDVGGQIGERVPEELTAEQKSALSQLVKDPTLDVYIGKDDGIVRRVSFDFKLEVPEGDRSQFQGVSGADLSVSVEFKDVGKPVTITPPANPKPISDLGKQLFSGGIPGLGVPGGSGIPGLDSGSGSGSGSSDSGSGSSGSGSSPPGSGTDLGTGGSGAEEAEKFQKYAECVQDAGSDQEKVAACTQQLR